MLKNSETQIYKLELTDLDLHCLTMAIDQAVERRKNSESSEFKVIDDKHVKSLNKIWQQIENQN